MTKENEKKTSPRGIRIEDGPPFELPANHVYSDEKLKEFPDEALWIELRDRGYKGVITKALE